MLLLLVLVLVLVLWLLRSPAVSGSVSWDPFFPLLLPFAENWVSTGFARCSRVVATVESSPRFKPSSLSYAHDNVDRFVRCECHQRFVDLNLDGRAQIDLHCGEVDGPHQIALSV